MKAKRTNHHTNQQREWTLSTASLLRYIKRSAVHEMEQLRQKQMVDPAWQREFS